MLINVCLLILATALNARAENTSTNESDLIESLNRVENLQVWGNAITIVSKNNSEPAMKNCKAFDQYLRTHLIRIKSPLQEDKYLYFELNDLVPEDEVAGRERKKKGAIRDLLLPFLLALKYKSTVALPLLMMTIAFVAFKAFWAGMSGLVISKVIGLKILLQYLNKPEEDHAEAEGQNHGNDGEHEDQEQPVVVYLQPQGRRRKFSKRYDKPPPLDRYYGPEGWDYWIRQREYENTKWDVNPLNWEQEPWF